MKQLLCTIFLAFSLLVSSAQKSIDVLHYKFSINLSDSNDTIYSTTEIKVKFLSAVNSFSIDLALLKGNGKGMILDKVTGPSVTGFSKEKERFTINLSTLSKINDTVSCTINYHGVPADGLIISKNKYGHRTFFADNWPNRAHNWLACIDDPADKASFEFIVKAPAHYQVVSNGIQVEESNLDNNFKLTHWKEDVPLPTKVMAIGVAEFAVNYAGNINCVPVYSWIFPEEKEKGFYDYAQAKEILGFFNNYIGLYPYKKLANVQSKTIFGGMENAGAIFYSETSVTGDRTNEDLMSHEIVHQWFGDMATEKSFAHLWLSEGFATYLTDVYIESKYGIDSMNKRLQGERDEAIAFGKTAPNPVVDAVSDYMSLLNPNSYQKAGWVLHMLRRTIGDALFQKFIKAYYDKYKGSNADTDDVRKVAEEVSGKKLEYFFKQWLYTPGNLQLNVSWKYLTKEKKLSVTVTQLQKTTFNFPLEMKLNFASAKSKLQVLNISKQTETFIFSIAEKIAKIELDPNMNLLFSGTVNEGK
jgi:aminopeptidase N